MLAHLLKWLALKRLTVSSVGDYVELLEFSGAADKNVKWYNHFENSMTGL